MLNITLICIGKLKEQYLRDACDEYKKRLSALCKLNIVELTPERLSDNPSQKEIENALSSEGKRIIEKIPNGSQVYTMCIEGKQLSSEELSAKLDADAVSGISNVTFIIGGSFGLSGEVKAKSNVRLSMSKMTFPHQLARVMLLEQIYRAMQISIGTKYHK
ncbi:MAG: 23S rRNA (pseudouridine(1915)-N(3))-methyltransferase RlmH [Faecalibacterium sp.]|nr:23S rRNA (pseudouridine(1915)-N(3))-methyltransferase RlmH [Ruminococcus sp.]MCM1391296.1 23S rRNA (pseudouridine(1915)-N(3))-methyltransferase RlmH [Ruminococcus sp.]MCM1484730.1 23S rRNA (pseudouridine(1915)-N(3))-methyltransferase RlmH [Faecalibacterium sp.]